MFDRWKFWKNNEISAYFYLQDIDKIHSLWYNTIRKIKISTNSLIFKEFQGFSKRYYIWQTTAMSDKNTQEKTMTKDDVFTQEEGITGGEEKQQSISADLIRGHITTII